MNVEANVSKSKEWLQKAVQKNSTHAFNVLGFIEAHYNDNLTAAMEIWKKGVEAGDVQAMFNYASVMEQRNHVSFPQLKYFFTTDIVRLNKHGTVQCESKMLTP